MPIEFLPQSGTPAIAIAVIAAAAVVFLIVYQAKIMRANRRQGRQNKQKEK